MYKVGMYGGSFNPLHLGHVNDIIKASNQCEELYVVLSVMNNFLEIDHRERFKWLKNITKHMSNVKVIEIFDDNSSKDSYDWDKGASDIKSIIAKKIDVVFAGDDYKDKNIWEKLYPEAEVIYFSRKEVNVSSTMIRENPYKYFDYLPSVVQRYYIKKVCIIGTESCGKTTLVENLALYFNTTRVLEAGRYICDDAGGIDNMQKYHYFDILFKHKQLEREALEKANKVLFIDTDSLITLYYYKLGFSTNNKIDKAFKKVATGISDLNDYDLYLFLEPDVAWIQDGTRTYGEDKVREDNNLMLKKLLKDQGIKYLSIKGNYEERYEKACEAVVKLLGGD